MSIENIKKALENVKYPGFSKSIVDFGFVKEAEDIISAVDRCIEEGYLTEDLRPKMARKCSEVGARIVSIINQ